MNLPQAFHYRDYGGFKGGDVKILCSDPKRHIPEWFHVIWATAHEHLLMGLSCRWWQKKVWYIKKFKILYFTTLPRRPCWTAFFTKVDMGAYLPDVIIYSQFHINQWRGFLFCHGSNFAVSHRKAWLPLTWCCTTVQLLIMQPKTDVLFTFHHKYHRR